MPNPNTSTPAADNQGEAKLPSNQEPTSPFQSNDEFSAVAEGVPPTRTLILHELQTTLEALNQAEIETALKAIRQAKRVFTAGAGRSKLALQMAAMRLMHLGLTVYVAGETTTPAIGPGDLLIVASASGTTASAIHAAEVASKAGAAVLLLTANPASPLAKLATSTLRIPAASKSDTEHRASQQYAGSLFEQSVLLTCDLLFHLLWKASHQTSEQLLTRHANLE